MDILEFRGRSSHWLAGEIGMHPSQFSRLLHGQTVSAWDGRQYRYRLSPGRKKAISTALGVPESVIFGG